MAAKVVLVVLASVLSMACTSSVVGTGEPTPGSGGDAPRTESNGGPSSDPSSSDPGDGVPDSIAALFSPPTSTSSTPDEIFGLWVATDSSWAYGLEARLKISPSSVIFAAKCKSDGEIVHVVLDRTFVADGVRWIVDFKTGTHEGGDPEAFLDAEVERYRPQLARYARIVSALDPTPIRLALYHPRVPGGWREVSAASGAGGDG